LHSSRIVSLADLDVPTIRRCCCHEYASLSLSLALARRARNLLSLASLSHTHTHALSHSLSRSLPHQSASRSNAPGGGGVAPPPTAMPPTQVDLPLSLSTHTLHSLVSVPDGNPSPLPLFCRLPRHSGGTCAVEQRAGGRGRCAASNSDAADGTSSSSLLLSSLELSDAQVYAP